MKLNKIFTFILVFVLMLTCVSINTLAEDNVDYLDLESTDTYQDSKALDQNYTFTQTGDTNYTHTTKVKLTWTINDITATYTSHKTWDPTNLQWVETKEDINVTNNDASFTLTNYSSEGIIANVEFKVEESLKDTFEKVTYTNNNCAVKTPVTRDNNTYQDSDFTALNKTITSEITFNKDKFADLSDTTNSTKYGTYTVTIKGPQYLTFTANEANSSVIPNFISGTWQYSTDNGKNWIDGTNYVPDDDGNVTSGTKTTITLTNAGEQVMLRGTDCQTGEDAQKNIYNFSMTGSIAASGDVTSLTNGIGGNEALTDECYIYMFIGCASLTTAPALPSETLAEACYAAMFVMCTSLTTAPALPATTLAKNCYINMFWYCTSLVTAPALPATTLAERCYLYMFSNCTSLITASALPATNLAEGCYGGMFEDCTNLKVTTLKPDGTEGTDWGIILGGAKTIGTDSLSYMFYGCACDSGVDATPTLGENITYYWYK